MEKLEDRNYPVMVLDNIPEFKTNDKLYERVVNVDTLLSPYEKPQISWRGSKGIRDELWIALMEFSAAGITIVAGELGTA